MWMWNALTPGLKFWKHGPQTLVLNWHVVVSLRGGTIEEVNYWVLESPCELYLSPCSDLSTLLSHPPTCEQASSCTCHHMIPNTKYYIPLCSGPSQSFLPRAVCARHSATAAGKLTHLLAAMKLALWVCWVSLVGGVPFWVILCFHGPIWAERLCSSRWPTLSFQCQFNGFDPFSIQLSFSYWFVMD